MKTDDRPRPMKEAGRITLMLDAVLGKDRFDRGPVDMEQLALEYSKHTNPEEPIDRVVGDDIEGCMGALVPSEVKPRKWAILYHEDQSPGRRSFTIGHEFGHYVLHRSLIGEDGIYCDAESVLRRNGEGIEKEADLFAASLLMPLHDFRAQLSAKTRADFKVLAKLAKRYGVSLTSAILRWLEYTETRAMVIVSNEGFAHWAKPSEPALKSGLFIRTKNEVFELPANAIAARREFTEEAKAGIQQDRDIWLNQPAIEMCFRSERYDQEITLLHFGAAERWFEAEPQEEDTYDAFVRRSLPISRD
jgi:Zn-dependent peptidase ImmA (M78 family)